MWRCILFAHSHTIQVWGLVSFIRFGFCQSLLADKRKSAPHFLFINNRTFGVGGQAECL